MKPTETSAKDARQSVLIARWENRTGKSWIELRAVPERDCYLYRGDSCSGSVLSDTDGEAVEYMESFHGAAGLQMRCNRNFKRTI